jgi:prepilin-type N-terminal cleavage/methylation domain-containing protein
MRIIVKALASMKKFNRSQRGFTLTEIVIVLMISALLLVGSSQIVYHMVVTSTKDRAEANALCQVQYVGFWISEDVMQARPDGVIPSSAPNLLTVQWTQWNGDTNQVIYSVEGEKTWKLSRHSLYTPKGGAAIDKGTSVVGEFLDPAGTTCYWDTSGNATNVLKLDVAANVDGQVASRTYEINPRSR